MNAILTMAIKDLRLLLRDKSGFFFTFFFPMIIAVFFGSIFSGGGEESRSIAILAVDEDGTEQSQEFIRNLDESQELTLSQTTRNVAEARVRLGKSVAYIALLKGFGDAQKNVFWGTPPEVELGVDPGQQATAGMLQGILMKYGVQGFQKKFSDSGIMHQNIGSALESIRNSKDLESIRKQHLETFLSELDLFLIQPTPAIKEKPVENGGFSGFEPLRIKQKDVVIQKTGPKSGYAVSFPQGILWGMMGCAASFGLSLVVERTRGALVRLRTAPVTFMQILAGKALACFATMMTISFGMVFFGKLFFNLQPNSISLMAMAIVSNCLGFVGIMMLLAVLGKTEQAAGGICWAILLIMSMIGGGMIPLFIMPAWMQNLSHVSPVKWAILAMDGAVWRQFTFIEMLLPCGIMLAVGLTCFVTGVTIFRMMQQD